MGRESLDFSVFLEITSSQNVTRRRLLLFWLHLSINCSTLCYYSQGSYWALWNKRCLCSVHLCAKMWISSKKNNLFYHQVHYGKGPINCQHHPRTN
jgi:hypothetical protein